MQVTDLVAAIDHALPGAPSELGIYLLAVAIALPLETWFGSENRTSWGERCGNLAAMLIHVVVGGIVLQLALATSIGHALAAFPSEPRHELLRNPYLWAFSSIVLVDAAFYGYHRLQHAVPLLWRIHKLHHTDPAMNVTTARRTHFLERTLQFLCLILPMLWALGMNLEGAVYATAVAGFFLYAAHADIRVDFGWLTPAVVGPLYHRIHHGRSAEYQNANFAQLFPVFDLLGGTYRRPSPQEHVVTGVESCATPRDRWRPLVW